MNGIHSGPSLTIHAPEDCSDYNTLLCVDILKASSVFW